MKKVLPDIVRSLMIVSQAHAVSRSANGAAGIFRASSGSADTLVRTTNVAKPQKHCVEGCEELNRKMANALGTKKGELLEVNLDAAVALFGQIAETISEDRKPKCGRPFPRLDTAKSANEMVRRGNPPFWRRM